MSKAVVLYSSSDGMKQVAVTVTGEVFVRYREKSRWGHKWSYWNARKTLVGDPNTVVPVDALNMTRASPNDCNVALRAYFNEKGEINVRLP